MCNLCSNAPAVRSPPQGVCVPGLLCAVKSNISDFWAAWQGCECIFLVLCHAAEALMLNELKHAKSERKGEEWGLL